MCALVTGVQTCALPISAMGIGNDMAMGAYDKMTQAGMIDQADRQGQLDADKAQWEGEDQRNWDLLNRYYSIIGGNQWGQSGTSSGTAKRLEERHVEKECVSMGRSRWSQYP